MIEFKSVTKKFGSNVVLDNLSLEIDKGGIFAILGPNGSGKTTLIKLILGMVVTDKGRVFLDKKDIKNQWQYRNNIQYLPQIANFPGNLSVKELLHMIMDIRSNASRQDELISKFGLENQLNKKLATLSGGTKQKVNLVLTFMYSNDLIILDEPTTGLDPSSLIALKELIVEEKEKGKTILLSSHILHFVDEMADEIIYLLEGKIYFKGKVSQLLEKTSQKDLEHAIAEITSTKKV